MRRTLVLLLAAVALSACGSTAPQPLTPIPSVNIRPDVPPPPGLAAFPDFNAFRPAEVEAYTGTGPRGDKYVAFKTDSAVSCFAYVYGARALGDISCDSHRMPGFPADANGQERRGANRTESVLREPSNGPFQFWVTASTVDDSAKVLPAGERLVVNDTGCAAGDDLLACIDGDHHGFVVSPKGSWAF